MIRSYIILGAPDPEMEMIERTLKEAWVPYAYAMRDGRRVHPGNAYEADGLSAPLPDAEIVLAVECGGPAIPNDAVVIDHHRPGDPGYGRPPAEYLAASSIGQVLDVLGIEPTEEHRLVAAADHCLSAAYRGECPGVDPDALMRWRVECRAKFQGRPVEAVLADVERAREALMDAPVVRLSPEPWEPACGVHGRTGACWQSGGPDPSVRTDACYAMGDPLLAVDMRERGVPELPEAAAREGVCFLARLTGPDGRTKIVCQAGSPEQIRAFMTAWAPAHGLVDIYGDPARGFAGGYLAT